MTQKQIILDLIANLIDAEAAQDDFALEEAGQGITEALGSPAWENLYDARWNVVGITLGGRKWTI